MRATIKDVAREAGVSHMTVSRVINNKNSILETTREKVLKAIEKLNYKPNYLARSLVIKKTGLIGILVPDIDNPFFSALVKSAEKIAQKNGSNLMLGDTGGEVDTEKKYMEIMLERMVDGIILVTPRMEDSTILRYSNLIPIVVVDRRLGQYDIPQVWADNRRGAILAMEYLLGLGHRRIGFISGPSGVQGSASREDGYRKTLANHNIHFDPDLVVRGDFLFESGYRSFEHFLRIKQPPTAVFSSNDIMAYGLIKRAMERGVNIPRDLSIVGFDNISLSALINPPLTTVDHPVAEMGRGAMELLFCEMRIDKDYKRCIALENTLVIRRSAARISPL